MEKVKLISTVGTFYTAMGDKYDGEWKNGKKNGKGKVYSNVGIYYYIDGSQYDGYWVEDKKNGQGCFIINIRRVSLCEWRQI